MSGKSEWAGDWRTLAWYKAFNGQPSAIDPWPRAGRIPAAER
jgi:hypothetical protein